MTANSEVRASTLGSSQRQQWSQAVALLVFELKQQLLFQRETLQVNTVKNIN